MQNHHTAAVLINNADQSDADTLLVAFDVNAAVGAPEIHPLKFCFKAMSRVPVAKEQKRHFKCLTYMYIVLVIRADLLNRLITLRQRLFY